MPRSRWRIRNTIPSCVSALSLRFCSKLSDTTASEVGKAYGKTTYNSLPTVQFRAERDRRCGKFRRGRWRVWRLVLCLPAWRALLGELNTGDVRHRRLYSRAAVCAFAAFVATTFESALGSLMQGRKGWEWLTNDVVNAIQIAIAAIVAIVFGRGFIEEVYACVRACVFQV